jgi:phasin
MTDAAFSAARFEVPDAVRSFAEQGLNQTREAYGRMKAAAEEATGAMEESFETTRENMREVQVKALDAAQANAEATFDFARKLLQVNSVAEAMQLHASFARERFEAVMDYSKDMQNTLTKVGSEASKPAKAMFERAVNQAKPS